MLAMACKLNEKMRALLEQVASEENPLELEIPRGQEKIYQAAFIVEEVNCPGSRGRRNTATSFRSRTSSARLSSPSGPFPSWETRCCFTQFLNVPALKTQIPGHLGNRFPRLQNNPYRPRLELRVVPSTYLRHKLLL